MKYNIYVTPYAKLQMAEIKEYTVNVLAAPLAAKKLLEKFEEAIKSLQFMPKRYRVIGGDFGKQEGIRRVKQRNFYIYYWINEDDNSIYILDIIYAKAEQEHLLKVMRENFEQGRQKNNSRFL